MGNATTVQAIYEAFGRGDIPFIIDQLADDVAWEQWDDNRAQQAGVPWLRGGTGKDAAVSFFGAVGALEVKDVQVLGIMEGADQVAVEFEIEVVVPETGHSFRDQEAHFWRFNDQGKVTRMRHYTDTAKHMEGAGLL